MLLSDDPGYEYFEFLQGRPLFPHAYLATLHTSGTPVNVLGEESGSSRQTLGAGLVNDFESLKSH